MDPAIFQSQIRYFPHPSNLMQQMAYPQNHILASNFALPIHSSFSPIIPSNSSVHGQAKVNFHMINFCTDCSSVNMLKPISNEINLEIQIKKIIRFFVDNYNIIRMKEVKEIREQYAAQDEKLAKVFDAIAVKYSSSKKPKEELVKWIIRKAFMEGKQSIKEGKKLTQKDLSAILCKRYSLTAKKEECGDSCHQDANPIESLLPYKKTSTCKTINKNFIKKIFASEEFQEDYMTFLDHFHQIIDKDTDEKMQKFAEFILESIKKKKISEIVKYKRVPWLKAWADKAKKIAIDIENNHIENKIKKEIKSEDSFSYESFIKSEVDD